MSPPCLRCSWDHWPPAPSAGSWCGRSASSIMNCGMALTSRGGRNDQRGDQQRHPRAPGEPNRPCETRGGGSWATPSRRGHLSGSHHSLAKRRSLFMATGPRMADHHGRGSQRELRPRQRYVLVEAVGIEPTSGNPQPQASTSIAGLSYCALALQPSIRQEDRRASLIWLAPPLERTLEPATKV